MDLNQMTTKTQEAIMSAQSLAVSHHHQEVDTVHLLLALLEEQDGLAVRIFQKMNVDIEALKQDVENVIKKETFCNGKRSRSWEIVYNKQSAATACKSRERSRKTAG